MGELDIDDPEGFVEKCKGLLKAVKPGGQGLDPRDDTGGVEIDISPPLGLESQMGRESQGGIGLNWRYDY